MDQISLLQHRLLDADALGATNFGISRGTSRDATATQTAEAVNRALSQVEAGDFETARLD